MEKVKPRCSIGFSCAYLRNRELGMKPKLGSTDRFMKGLYTSFLPCTYWDHNESLQNAAPGGIFNLEFSPDGSLLVAACEKRSILMFDPLSRQLLNTVDNAHFDCVNCVRFLDSRVFATCSDDSTVALWDARNLKTRIRTLHGHSNWVKNIEFSQSDGLLVTSGFDGSIYTWDINSYTESGFLYNRVFHTNGLMRTRLNPDASKMIICTTGGYLILIHNLDLRTLAQDLEGFKPNMYRLMQLSQTTIPVAANFTHLFSKKRKKNRIEFLTDFPDGDDAEVVSSLQVHPQGWCALSRNISNDENSEWTCVHDIQDLDIDTSSQEDEANSEQSAGEESDAESEQSTVSSSSTEMASMVIGLNSRARVLSSAEAVGGRVPRRVLRRQNAFRGFRAQVVPDRGELTVTSTDVWEALVAIREARARRDRRPDAPGADAPESRLRIVRMQSGIEAVRAWHADSDIVLARGDPAPTRADSADGSVSSGPNSNQDDSRSNNTHTTGRSFYIISRPPHRMKVPKNHKIHQNTPRLTHFIEESNVGKGFIKELCFSADGRLICSPFGYGVRLLSFSPTCSELSSCVPEHGRPARLHEIGTNVSHSDIVVSTKFSPRHCLLVSGCLTGRIVWHQPVL
uniref:Putative wd40 domain protein n=1 Tax=Panstrongylus lignarius TaxID=156445 RepID=A0A224XL80_9HEMI